MLMPRSGRPLQVPAKQNTKPVIVPAPQKGINAVDGLVSMDPQESIYQFNLVPSQYGTRVRTGYREFATDIGTGGVRTLIPFSGPTVGDNRLFACVEDGIYDISAGGDTFAAALTFGSTGDTSGYGQWTSFTTIAGYFALYTDETNGYFVYTQSTDTWAAVAMGGGATEISGVNPATFAGVTIFKSRAWFIEAGTASAWYLPVGAIYGAATEFNFGNKFKHGGTLVQLINWTVDGGEGMDDYLIAISSAGDVVVYKGNDPATATDFTQHGAWFIGAPPAGRRIGGSFGGEVYLLSTYGLLPMSKLISGTLVQREDIYLSKKITPLINEQMAFTRTNLGWEVKLIPGEQLLMVSAPERPGFNFTQFVQSLNTEGWAIYHDIPYFTGEVWQETFYMGSDEGIVYTHQGDLDNVSLDDTTYEQINWSALQIFSEYGETGQFHRAQFIRPVFLAEQNPAYSVEAKYDYDLAAIIPPAPAVLTEGSVWDSAIWDLDFWAGDFVVVQNPVGASGMGRAMAVGISGSSGTRTILVRYDLMFDSGGLL